jgi:hypothetical protein
VRFTELAVLAILVATAPLGVMDTALAATTDPPGGIGIKLTEVPAEALQADPRADSYIVGAVEPGSSLRSQITVSNPSTEAQTVYLYTGAAHIAEGTFQGEANPSANDLTSWTELDASEISLEGGGSETLAVTIAVPADAAPGEQYGAVWAEVRGASSADSPVIQANRVGVRMYVTVGGNNAPGAEFTVTSLAPSRNSEGVPQVSALVTNSGGRAVDIIGTLTLTNGPSGLSAGPFELAQATTIAPGDAQDAVFTLGEALPNGPWSAQVTLTSGSIERTAQATIMFPEDGTGQPVTPSGPGNTLLISLVAGTLLLFASGAVAAVVLRHRAATRKDDLV